MKIENSQKNIRDPTQHKAAPGLIKIFVGHYLHLFVFLDPIRPFESWKLISPETRLVSTRKKHTKIIKQQTNKESEFRPSRKLPKTTQIYAIQQYSPISIVFKWFLESFLGTLLYFWLLKINYIHFLQPSFLVSEIIFGLFSRHFRQFGTTLSFFYFWTKFPPTFFLLVENSF